MNDVKGIPKLASPNAEEVLSAPAFLDELEAIGKDLSKSPEEALEYARDCLDELAVHPEEKYLHRVAKLATFMLSRSYEPTLDVDTAEVDRLKRLAGERPMVFLWSHKSHLDSFVFMKAMYDQDFRPQPLSFAGINMAFAGFRTLARKSGAIFLRRTFRDDPIYKLVFRHYIDCLVRGRFPLSWSIEGTRSRTGKLMPPKTGLIRWVVESYKRNSSEDVLFVPVSISFDQIAEIDDYVAIQSGQPKRKESLRWFVGYVSGMKARNGRICVRFGEPVALSDEIEVSDSMFAADAAPAKIQIQKLAFEVMSRIEHATPIRLTDLVSTVLLGANDRALTQKQVHGHARDIVALVKQRALPSTGELSLDSTRETAGALAALSATKLVECYADGREPVYRIAPGKHLAAAYYRNTIVHYFLSSAIAELALVTLANGESGERFEDIALHYRDLFKFEFFFQAKDVFCTEAAAYLDERHPSWRSIAGREGLSIDTLFGEHPPLFGHSILRSFVEAYRVLATVLIDRGDYEVGPDQKKKLLQDCLKVGREMLLRKQISTDAALSNALFATGWDLAGHRGLLSGPNDELGQRREAFRAEIDAAHAAVEVLQHYYDKRQESVCDS